MKQDDLAEATGLSNVYISNIENSRSVPSIETLMKICAALGRTPDYFLLGAYRDVDEKAVERIVERVRLCDRGKLRLVERFLEWVGEEEV